MSWFVAHAVMKVEFKEPHPKTEVSCWENLLLVEANSAEEAFAKAERRAKEDEGDHQGSFHWEGLPATWVFQGVRRLVACESENEQPKDGTELTYLQFVFPDDKAFRNYMEGDCAAVTLDE